MNYREHCTEQGLPIPTEPVIFSKFASAICAPGDPIPWEVGETHLAHPNPNPKQVRVARDERQVPLRSAGRRGLPRLRRARRAAAALERVRRHPHPGEALKLDSLRITG